jgi:type I restriction enzyme S subunit
MRALEQLIQQSCPNGVPLRKISDFSCVLRGKRLTKSQLIPENGYPVYHGGLEPLGYYGSCNREKDTVMVINVGASAGTVGYCKEDFWSSDGCYCLQKSPEVNPRYLYFALQVQERYIKTRVRHAGIPTLDSKVLENLEIPVPPLNIQAEIISILDKFAELNDLITEEISLREQQSEWCRVRLFNASGNDDCIELKLSECCTLEKGKTAIQKAKPGQYPMVVTTSERKSSNTYQFDKPTVCVPLVSSRGHGIACLNQVYYQEGKFALGNILCGVSPLDEKLLNAKYLYYYLNFKKDTLIVPLMKGDANVSLTVDSLKGVKILVPSIERQYEIIRMLDKFGTILKLLNENEQLNYKRYEYYREKLFSL